jgi:O-antigen ligase
MGGPPPWARRTADVLLALVAASVPLSTTGMEAGVLALGALTAVGAVAGWGVVRRTPLDGALAIFFATLALSTLASGHPLEAVGWDGLWVVLAYFVVYWWLADRSHAVRVVRWLVLGGAVVAAYGILQHYTGADWYRAALGRRRFVHPRETDSDVFAVVGFFRNYLTFAHTMVFPLAWSAAGALRGSLLGAVTAPLLVVAIAFSTARGVWLACLAMAVALAALAGPKRAGRTLAALALAAGVAFAVTPDLRTQVGDMLATSGENAARLAIYRANLDIVHDHPVLGLGFGRYRTAAVPYYDAHPDANRRSHAHNDYLHIAAEAGLAGLAAFALLFGTALLRGRDAVRAAPDARVWAVAAGAWVGVVGFLVGGLTQYNFGDNEVALAMWVALGVLMRCREP